MDLTIALDLRRTSLKPSRRNMLFTIWKIIEKGLEVMSKSRMKMKCNIKININVKGVSNRKNKILHLEYIYPDTEMTLRDFLIQTVKITVRDYNKGKASDEVLKSLSAIELADEAATGKVTFGIHYDKKEADEEEAIANVLQCFQDGMIAVFVDKERYEMLEQVVPLKENSEVTFVRLTFLAGRMW